MLADGYYPHVMVVCGPAAHRLYETDPVVVVEVLSPSTAALDFGDLDVDALHDLLDRLATT